MKYEASFGASTFKRRLLLLMDEQGLSQNAVAAMAGVSQGTVSRWLAGNVPDLDSVTRLASKASVPIPWLAHGEGKLKIDYQGINGFLHRAKTKTIPRLNGACDRLSVLIDSGFFSEEERENMELLLQRLRSQRATLAACVEALEKLPQEEEGAVRKILSNHYVPAQTEFVRGELCVALGLRGTSTNDEILNACRIALEENPHPGARKGTKRGRSTRVSQGKVADVVAYQEGDKTKYRVVLRSEKSAPKVHAK